MRPKREPDALPTAEPAGAEQARLEESRRGEARWPLWGPYLAERAWGTVREDYSPDGSAWDYFPHDHARSRVYRWNEDGLLGLCDERQRICFALALWNGRDPILKERLFGLSGTEGNHGEDVKECYFYLDSTPTHSYMKALYKYPQAEFPYGALVEENRRRGKDRPEYELLDTGVFDDNRYFDVFVEYAKAAPGDVAIRITAANRGPEAAELHLLPTLWLRNRWAWGYGYPRGSIVHRPSSIVNCQLIELNEPQYGNYWLACEGSPELLFTENESNCARIWGGPNPAPYVKDAFHERVIHGSEKAVNPDRTGTKAAAWYRLTIPAGDQVSIRLRLTSDLPAAFDTAAIDALFEQRRLEANEFYADVIPASLTDEERTVARQAFAGLLWSKQHYHFVVQRWLDGDPATPKPPDSRHQGRNHAWRHLFNTDVLSMPDKWEYPWYAAWDLAFHCIPLAIVDSEFAKHQLTLLLREWYMHPNGQLPAYEWAFGDVNPPVHAWAALRVYQIERRRRGKGDRAFLERVFHKLLLNFTWWVNRKDPEDLNVFQGGFLGLDNIGVFDRSKPLPGGGHLDQSDGTSWMAMFTLNMLAIALELATHDRVYEDVATKFFEHFLYIAHAMNDLGKEGIELWHEGDGFFYDWLHMPDGRRVPLRARSMVGLIPLCAVEVIEPEHIAKLDGFRARLEWFIENRPDLTKHVYALTASGQKARRLMSIVDEAQLKRVLSVMLDESEFLSPYGLRSLSRRHLAEPFVLEVDGFSQSVDYEPAESTTGLFGGNSNWRGPVWFPLNYLLIEALQRYDYYYGDDFKIECPAGSGRMMTLWEVSLELSRRLTALFLPDDAGRRPVNGSNEKAQADPNWRDRLLFYEFFHGDTGQGLGASHQTGWTALVAKLLQQSGQYRR